MFTFFELSWINIQLQYKIFGYQKAKFDFTSKFASAGNFKPLSFICFLQYIFSFCWLILEQHVCLSFCFELNSVESFRLSFFRFEYKF